MAQQLATDGSKTSPLAKKSRLLVTTGQPVFILYFSHIQPAAAEWAVRTWLPSPDYGAVNAPLYAMGSLCMTGELGWKGTPNARSPYISKDFIVHVTHDEHAFRNQTPTFIPKAQYFITGRLTAGDGVLKTTKPLHLFSNQQNPNANIYNLSVPGYGTDQEPLTLQRFSKQHPDKHYDDVVILLYYNDFEDNIATERYSYPNRCFSKIKTINYS
ncbi:MAG: hypothetical protein R3E61_08590 [Pseudomonadales bacterium]